MMEFIPGRCEVSGMLGRIVPSTRRCCCLSPDVTERCDGTMKGTPETCRECGRWYTPGEEPDPCLGWLAGVVGACCGHGVTEGYISFPNGVVIRPYVIEKDSGVVRPSVKP